MSQSHTDLDDRARSPDYAPVADPDHPHPEEPKRMTTNEVRQAKNVQGMLPVLIISMVFVILGFAAVYYWA
jgi:hypothetical protein